jgi:hypothetical protein
MHPKYWKPNRNHFLRAPVDGEGSAGAGGESSQSSLVESFSSFFSGESQEENAAHAQHQETESPEAAAERIAAEEAASANQKQTAEGETTEGQVHPNADTFTIEVDGKPVQLTKAELAEHYKSSLRQRDSAREVMEAAETRKTAEAEIQRTRAERDNYAQQLHNFAITSESILAEQAKVLTDELLRTDPVEYLAQQRTFQERQANLQRAHAELQRVNGERQKEYAEAQQIYKREQLEKLHAKLPEWKDVAKAKTEANQIRDYLQGQDFDAQDIESLSDHRHVLLARKAMLYDSLMARAKEAAGKVSKAPAKVERPGTPMQAPDGRTAVMKQFANTGSRDDAARAFAEIFG